MKKYSPWKWWEYTILPGTPDDFNIKFTTEVVPLQIFSQKNNLKEGGLEVSYQIEKKLKIKTGKYMELRKRNAQLKFRRICFTSWSWFQSLKFSFLLALCFLLFKNFPRFLLTRSTHESRPIFLRRGFHLVFIFLKPKFRENCRFGPKCLGNEHF